MRSADVYRITTGVQHSKDQDVVTVEAIEDAVRELTHPRSPDAGEPVDRRSAVRERGEPIHHAVELVEKAPLEILVDRTVVLGGLGEIADRKLGKPERHCSARS